MKCPNCYSRKINNQKCEMCGKDIMTFQLKRNTIKKTIIIVAIIVFLLLTLIVILNSDKIIAFFNSSTVIDKIKRNYKAIIKQTSLLIFGVTSVILMLRGSFMKDEIKLYDSYLLGKIVDYRPSLTKGLYHPIVEYEVNDKKYRVVGRSTKVRELEGLVGVRYKGNSPIEAIIDGEKNANLIFALGIFIFVIILASMIIYS